MKRKTSRRSAKTLVGLCLAIAASGLGLGAVTAHAQTFVNGGFEADAWPAGSNAGESPAGWAAALSGDGDWPYGVHNTADTTDEYTPFGTQFVELCARDCSNDLPRGSISQTVSGFVIGEQYRLNFQHAPENHPGASEESIVNVSIVGGTPASANFSGQGVGGYFAQWKAQSMVFTATATSLTFTFSGVANSDSNTESGIDEVSVTRLSIPPPAAPSTSIPTLSFYGLALTILALLLVVGRNFRASSRRR